MFNSQRNKETDLHQQNVWKKPCKRAKFQAWVQNGDKYFYLRYHHPLERHSQHTSAAKIRQQASLYMTHLPMVFLSNLFEPHCPRFKGKICLPENKMAAFMKYVEIPLSSGEENHVDIYMAINIGKQNQNKIF